MAKRNVEPPPPPPLDPVLAKQIREYLIDNLCVTVNCRDNNIMVALQINGENSWSYETFGEDSDKLNITLRLG